MKFQVSTKPLVDALNLGVVNQNVSKYYQKSCLAQITASRRDLKINLEAESVLTEVNLKGSGDCEDTVSIFVDCLLLKQLVSTFEASITTLEYVEGGLVLHSGSSKFTLPKMLDDAELELNAPNMTVPAGQPTLDIDKTDWKFIKEHQMYAIAMSFIHPVYTRVWVGESGDVLVGDFDNSLFTHSKKSKLGKTCLLQDTIIHLFNSLPDGAKLTQLEDSYLITVSTDGFDYATEFKPLYESDEGVGSYSSEIILDMMKGDEANAVVINVPAVNKVLSQANLLSASTEDSVKFEVGDGNVSLINSNIDCKLPTDKSPDPYSLEFKIGVLNSVISNFDEDTICVSPMEQEDGQVAGIILWSKSMTVVLAGIDE